MEEEGKTEGREGKKEESRRRPGKRFRSLCSKQSLGRVSRSRAWSDGSRRKKEDSEDKHLRASSSADLQNGGET